MPRVIVPKGKRKTGDEEDDNKSIGEYVKDTEENSLDQVVSKAPLAKKKRVTKKKVGKKDSVNVPSQAKDKSCS